MLEAFALRSSQGFWKFGRCGNAVADRPVECRKVHVRYLAEPWACESDWRKYPFVSGCRSQRRLSTIHEHRTREKFDRRRVRRTRRSTAPRRCRLTRRVGERELVGAGGVLSRPRPNEAFGITQGKLTTLNPSGPYVRQGMSSCPDQKNQ